MLTASECFLKADNFMMAAKFAAPEARMIYIQQAAQWRQLAHELQMERFGPFAGDGLTPQADHPGRAAMADSQRTAD